MSVVAVPEGCGIQINRKLFCADVHCPNAEQGVAELLQQLFTSLYQPVFIPRNVPLL